MTDYSKLTDDQLNTLAAKHCGWTDIEFEQEFIEGWFGIPPNASESRLIPDYCKLERLGRCIRDFLPVLEKKKWCKVLFDIGHDNYCRVIIVHVKDEIVHGDLNDNLARTFTELFCKAMEEE
jgi:hypothetical protein